jgi:murein DD-endopeptidase MepM/ murein hydrolase activator NlpD
VPRTRSSDDATRKRFLTGGCGAAACVLVATSPALGSGTGGVGYVATPKISRIACVQACASRKRARGGSQIRLSGANLAAVTRIVFAGGPGKTDDVEVRVRPRGERSLRVAVPLDAPSGPLVAWVADTVRSKASEPLAVLPPPPPPPPTGELTPVEGPADPGAPRLETAMSAAKIFVGSRYGVTFSYRVSDEAPVDVRVDLLRLNDGATVQTWTPGAVQPGQVNNLQWKGFAGELAAPEGRYAFRLSASGSHGAQAKSAQGADPQRDAFDLYQHIFPVRGRHDFGQAGARFGAGRDGHVHQGQDVFARCGTRIVAARGGVVKFKQYHSAAGHYVVIDGDREDVDYAYAHLQSASPFDVGDRVSTGQEIGRVGDSGNASGCHLHFEMWGAPGWYDGGRPFDPLPSLQGWDTYS